MITRNGESTAIQGAEGSHNGDTTGNHVTDGENNIFYTLRSSDLLKHLLGTDKKRLQHCTREHNEWIPVSQNISKKLPEVIQCDSSISSLIQLDLTYQNGSVEEDIIQEAIGSQETEKTSGDVQNSWYQVLQQLTPLETALPVFSYNIFNSESMDCSQVEAQSTLSFARKNSCELTSDLQPLSAPRCDTERELRGGLDDYPQSRENDCDMSHSEVSFEDISDKGSDNEVNEVMVLVPAGNAQNV